VPRLWPFRGSGESDVHVGFGIKHRAIVNEARNVEVAYSLDPGVTELDVDYLQEGEAVASARFEQPKAKTVLFRHTVRLQPGEYEARITVYGPDGRGVEHGKVLVVPAEGLTRFDLREATSRSE